MKASREASPSPAKARRSGASESTRRIRVLIADDHAIVREGLQAMIRLVPEMEVVAVADTGRRAVDLWREHRPDVTLLDLRMPDMGGVEALQEIRRQGGEVRAIMLTTFDCDEDVYRALRGGAKAYLLKDVAGEELLTCIRKVHAGESYVPPSIAARLATRLSGPELTGREGEVLTLLAEGRSNKEIAARLFISETTVKSHVKGLFAKLRVFSRTEAMAAAVHRGLIRL